MKTNLIILQLMLILNGMTFSAPVTSQNEPCSCSEEFEFLKDYVEKNHPAFGDNVNESNISQYHEFVAQLVREIQKDPVNDHCILYLKSYLAYFKDNHSQINDRGIVVDENDEEAMKQFFSSSRFQQRERATGDLEDIEAYLNSGKADALEGIYESQDGAYKVAVVKNQNNFRDYYGVILESKTKIWEPGQVKFELKKLDENRFQGYFYYKFYSLNSETVSLEGIRLGSWKKLGVTTQENVVSAPSSNPYQNLFEFRKIDVQTGYLSIRTFDGYFKNQFDSLLEAHETDMLNIPKLIIDVRGNGGGSDALLAPFYPLFYTDTIKTELPQIYATKDNLNTYRNILEGIKADSIRYGRGTIEHFEKMIKKMKNAGEGEFINMFDPIEGQVDEMNLGFGSQVFTFNSTMSKNSRYRLTYCSQKESLPSKPEKIVVLMDRECASTCENFILLAIQSKKVITYGDNSGGYKGYGNVFTVKSPMGYNLNMSTTRYEEQAKFEFVGIPPMVRASQNEDWMARAVELLETDW